MHPFPSAILALALGSGVPDVGSQVANRRAQGYRSANYSYTANAIIANNTVDTDPNSMYSTGTYTITPNSSGYYLASMRADYTNTGNLSGFIAKNGSPYKYPGSQTYFNPRGTGGSCLVYCNGSTDTLASGTTRSGTMTGGLSETYLNAIGPFNQSAFQVASAYMSANGGSGTLVKLPYNTALFDPLGIFNASNNRFQPTKPGYYIVGAKVAPTTFTSNSSALAVYKNGTIHQHIGHNSNVTPNVDQGGHCVVYLNGTTDYVEIYHTGGAVIANAATCYAEIVGPMPGMVCASYLSGSGSLTANTASEIAQDAVLYDTAGVWNATTKRFVPNQAGYYWCMMRGECTTGSVHEGSIFKNGAFQQKCGPLGITGTYATGGSGALIYLNGTTDYLKPASYRDASTGTLVAGSDKTWFSMIGPF